MKNYITKSILIMALAPTAAIYLIRTIEISIPLFIIILLANILTILIVGYDLKIKINNHYKFNFKKQKH